MLEEKSEMSSISSSDFVWQEVREVKMLYWDESEKKLSFSKLFSILRFTFMTVRMIEHDFG